MHRYQIHYSPDMTHVWYTFDGKPVNHSELTGPKADLAKKYQFAIKELEITGQYLDLVLLSIGPRRQIISPTGDHIDNHSAEISKVTAQGLFAAATIAYGKIFSSTGKGRMQFKPEFFFSGKEKEFEPLHSWWMSARHEYIAHSVDSPYDNARIVFLVDPPDHIADPNWWHLFPHVQFNRIPYAATIKDLASMTGAMLSILASKQHELLKNIAESIKASDISFHRGNSKQQTECYGFPEAPLISNKQSS